MNALEFIFKFLFQFISFDDGRWSELKDKAFQWRLKVERESLDEGFPEDQKLWYHKLIKHDNEWYVQIGIALFFLFAVKSVRTWLLTDASDFSDEDDEDDDDDEREIPLNRVRTMSKVGGQNFRM